MVVVFEGLHHEESVVEHGGGGDGELRSVSTTSFPRQPALQSAIDSTATCFVAYTLRFFPASARNIPAVRRHWVSFAKEMPSLRDGVSCSTSFRVQRGHSLASCALMSAITTSRWTSTSTSQRFTTFADACPRRSRYLPGKISMNKGKIRWARRFDRVFGVVWDGPSAPPSSQPKAIQF